MLLMQTTPTSFQRPPTGPLKDSYSHAPPGPLSPALYRYPCPSPRQSRSPTPCKARSPALYRCPAAPLAGLPARWLTVPTIPAGLLAASRAPPPPFPHRLGPSQAAVLRPYWPLISPVTRLQQLSLAHPPRTGQALQQVGTGSRSLHAAGGSSLLCDPPSPTASPRRFREPRGHVPGASQSTDAR